MVSVDKGKIIQIPQACVTHGKGISLFSFVWKYVQYGIVGEMIRQKYGSLGVLPWGAVKRGLEVITADPINGRDRIPLVILFGLSQVATICGLVIKRLKGPES